MSKATRPADDGLSPEYDFASMKGGVRGKYAVNEALRGVLNTTRAVRGNGGLPNKALQPTLGRVSPKWTKVCRQQR